MAKDDWWFKFEIPAWRNSPELRRCSLETRGFWIDCIAVMRDEGSPTLTGTVVDIARMIGCFPEEASRCIDELKRTKTADISIEPCNGNVTLGNASVTFLNGDVTATVTLVSRKYLKEVTSKEKTRLRVEKHRRDKDVTRDVTDDVTDVQRYRVKSNKKEVRKEGINLDSQLTQETGVQNPFSSDLTKPDISPAKSVENRTPSNPAVVIYENTFGPIGSVFSKTIAEEVKNLGLWKSLIAEKSAYADDEKKRSGVATWIIAEYHKRLAAVGSVNSDPDVYRNPLTGRGLGEFGR